MVIDAAGATERESPVLITDSSSLGRSVFGNLEAMGVRNGQGDSSKRGTPPPPIGTLY